MITEARIDTIVAKAIPLNASCKIEREKELKRREKAKTAILELLAEGMAWERANTIEQVKEMFQEKKMDSFMNGDRVPDTLKGITP